jgi:predicted GNAT family acetyltransferase
MIYKIDFETISKVWRENLWTHGDSANKRYNKIKIGGKFDEELAKKTTFYWAYKLDDNIVGVNSGYISCDNYYRSRGLWVDSKFRGAGFAKTLLDIVIAESIFWNCKYVWSYPREESLGVYESVGFKKQGEFEVASYGFNCIAVKENV